MDPSQRTGGRSPRHTDRSTYHAPTHPHAGPLRSGNPNPLPPAGGFPPPTGPEFFPHSTGAPPLTVPRLQLQDASANPYAPPPATSRPEHSHLDTGRMGHVGAADPVLHADVQTLPTGRVVFPHVHHMVGVGAPFGAAPVLDVVPLPPPRALGDDNGKLDDHPGIQRWLATIRADPVAMAAIGFSIIALTLNFITHILFDCGFATTSQAIIGLRLGAAAVGMVSSVLHVGDNAQSTPGARPISRATGALVNPAPLCTSERITLSIMPTVAALLNVAGFILSGLGYTFTANILYDVSIYILGLGSAARLVPPADSSGYARGRMAPHIGARPAALVAPPPAPALVAPYPAPLAANNVGGAVGPFGPPTHPLALP